MATEAETTPPQAAPAQSEQITKNLVFTLSDRTKVKRRVPRQRSCNEPAEKGKICAGHLKRWYFFGDEVKQRLGAEAEVYRCENCKTLYLPAEGEEPRSGTLSW